MRPQLKNRLLLFAGAMVLGALVAWVFYVQAFGPIHQGKRMRVWVHQLHAENQPQITEAQNVFLSLREAGVPWLARELERGEGSGPTSWIEKALTYFPRRLRSEWSPELGSAPAKARILETIVKLGPAAASAAPAVATCLYSRNYRLTSMAGEALGSIGPAAVPVLRPALHSTNHQARVNALNAARLLHTNSAVLLPDILAAYAIDSNVRPRVALVLSTLSPHADHVLLPLLTTNDVAVAADAAYALAHSRVVSSNFVPVLIDSRNHPDIKFRRYVYLALCNAAAGSRPARHALLDGLEDPNVTIQLDCIHALSMFPREAGDNLDKITPFLSLDNSPLQVAALHVIRAIGTGAAPARAKV
ncbi:MAG TPA: hypothetical protein VEH27_01855, partial [Methylomirabilota bacterium]|nr:hypothetical protein [Methylomirabilota bacterium]